MRQETLSIILSAREKKIPIALVTDLAAGEQAVLTSSSDLPGLDETNTLILDHREEEAVYTALTDDSSLTLQNEHDSTRKLFVQIFTPPLRMIIVGAVHIAHPLAPMAQLAGYEVIIIDPRQSFATDARFPGVSLIDDWPDDALDGLNPDRRTAIVTLTHDPKLDDPALLVALRSPAFYIGCLGSKRTHAKRVQRLTDVGFTEEDINRLAAPVGLAIGAKSPAEIALSIMAEITRVRRRAAPLVRATA